MSWMNEDLDDLFRDLADQQSFRYRKSYFRDIERYLPIRKSRKPIVGLLGFLSFFFIGVWFFAGNDHVFLLKSVLTQRANDSKPISNRKWASNQPFLGQFPSIHLKNETKNVNLNQSQVKTSKNTLISPDVDRGSYPIPFVEKGNDVFANKALISELRLKPVELSINTSQAVYPLESIKKSDFSPWSIVFSAYSGIGQGWTKEAAAATNASIGFQTKAKYTFNRFSVQAGVGMEWMRFDQLNIMERTKIYGLSSQLLENTYAFKSMTSVHVPVAMNYTIGRHQFGAGVTGILNTVAKVKRTCSLDGQGIFNDEGYTDAKLFGTIHLQSELQYHYHVSENLSIGVAAGVRITNPILSNRMEGDYVKHPVFLNVVLSKTLTKNP